MLIVEVVTPRGGVEEQFHFSDSEIEDVKNFARIGSQHGRPRRVLWKCKQQKQRRLVRIYRNGERQFPAEVSDKARDAEIRQIRESRCGPLPGR